MRRTMAKLLIAAFFESSVQILGIKMMTERKVNIRRAQFLSCMGMREKDRRALLRSEMRVYYILTVLISGVLSAALILLTMKARLYEAADAAGLLKTAVPFGVCELIAFGAVMWILTEYNVRRIERGL